MKKKNKKGCTSSPQRGKMEKMTMLAASPAAMIPSVQVVGNAFVEQYYHILHHSPELVYKFYQDSSVLSRPDSDGIMTSVTTMQAINEKIQSLDDKNYKAEIKTADAQESYQGGVIVLVTGCVTGADNVRRKFTQTFFLAPQEKGYFVLNDVFRYVEESEQLEIPSGSVHGINNGAPMAQLASDPVKVSKVAAASASVNVPAGRLRWAPPNANQQARGSAKPSPEPEVSAPTSDSAPESSNVPDEVEGHSIYMRNLALNETFPQLEEAFKKIGPRKRSGIQAKSNKESPITVGGRQAVVEEKRTTSQVSSSGRGGFRNETFRDRGDFGNSDYGSNELRNQGDFSSRPMGPNHGSKYRFRLRTRPSNFQLGYDFGIGYGRNAPIYYLGGQQNYEKN